MATQTSVQDWAKGRLADMDAKVAMLESKAGQLHGAARAKAENALADLRTRRDHFQAMIKKEEEHERDGESTETAFARAKASLEAHVQSFEATAKKALSRGDGSSQ